MSNEHATTQPTTDSLLSDKSQAPFCESPRGVFSECPHCGSNLYAEHAHFRCATCGWRDSCCD
ncbi:MAG: hypothetical protein ACOVLJ_07415 [Ilumatobacteraceae bacterium]